MRPSFQIAIILIILTGASAVCFGQNSKNNKLESEKDIVKARLLSLYDWINMQDLTDSLTFNKLKDFYAEDFVMLPGKAKPLSDKETILEGWRGLFKENKGNFDVGIDRVDVAGEMAYVLLHYHETFTNLQTGVKGIDVMHSDVTILKKDSKGVWKIRFVHWN